MSYPPVAAPPARRTPTWFWLVIGFVVLVLVAAGATAAVFLVRRLGGGTVKGDVAYTLHLSAQDGSTPTGDAVDRTRKILLDRLRQLDVDRPTVTTTGADTLRVTAAHTDAERAKSVLVPGNLTFRHVLTQTPDHPAGDCKADGATPADPAGALASARTKLGDATFAAATALTGPDDPKAAQLKGFDGLGCAEVAALPPAMQYAVPAITCAMLGHRPAGTLADGEKATACDTAVKYQLDAAKVTGPDLESAEAKIEPSTGQWVVNLHFTAAGQPKWTALTQDALNEQVAVLLDNTVITAPTIQGVITGDASVSGGDLSTRAGATALAATLGHGVLPLRVIITATDTVR